MITYSQAKQKYNFLLSIEQASVLYDIMKIVDNVFTRHGITYSATGGTLIGTVRHNGLIPWDDDLDIMVFYEDEYKKMYEENFVKALNGEGCNLVIERSRKYVTHIYKESNPRLLTPVPIFIKSNRMIFKKHNMPYNNGKPIVGNSCDIFPLHIPSQRKPDKFIPYWRGYRNRDHVFRHEVSPTIRTRFGSYDISILKGWPSYLNRCFGKNVMNQAELTRSHTGKKTEENVIKVADNSNELINLQVPYVKHSA